MISVLFPATVWCLWNRSLQSLYNHQSTLLDGDFFFSVLMQNLGKHNLKGWTWHRVRKYGVGGELFLQAGGGHESFKFRHCVLGKYLLCIGEKKTSDMGAALVHLYWGTGFPWLDLQLRVTLPFTTGFPVMVHTGGEGGTGQRDRKC